MIGLHYETKYLRLIGGTLVEPFAYFFRNTGVMIYVFLLGRKIRLAAVREGRKILF